MRKLIESSHVTLGGRVDAPQEWAFPFLDDEHNDYATQLLASADALLLGRITYEGLAPAYLAMADGDHGAPSEFIERMNRITKFVASTTMTETTWNASVIDGDVASFVADLKGLPGGNIVRYGNGPLDATLMEHGLIDEFHLLLTPVAVGGGHQLFESVASAPVLELVDVARFASGVLKLVYVPS
jgi:dihydrofolate reductase